MNFSKELPPTAVEWVTQGEGVRLLLLALTVKWCVSYWSAVETGYLMQGLDDILITNQTGNAMLWVEDVVGKNTSDPQYPAAARRRMDENEP